MYLDLLAYSTSLAFFNYLILPASNVRELFNQNKLKDLKDFLLDMNDCRSVMLFEMCTYCYPGVKLTIF